MAPCDALTTLALTTSLMPSASDPPTRDPQGVEVASGTGQHCAHLAAALPLLTLQPTEYDVASMTSIAAYVSEAALPNLLPPIHVDVSKASVNILSHLKARK